MNPKFPYLTTCREAPWGIGTGHVLSVKITVREAATIPSPNYEQNVVVNCKLPNVGVELFLQLLRVRPTDVSTFLFTTS